MAVHPIVPNAYHDVLYLWGKIGFTAITLIYILGMCAGIIGGYRLVNPPFLVVPGAVAIEQILSVVHINDAVFFVGVIIAG